MPQPRVKVCCIQSIEEAALAVRHGAAALGLVSAMPSGPGVIDDTRIAAIATRVPPPIGTFLLTSLQDPTAIIDQQRRCRTNTVQLCDALPLEAYPLLREALPGVALVQVIHVTGPAAVGAAEEVAPHVDALLLDSGNPALPVKQLGGTGRTHDWSLSRRIVDRVAVPVFLAGGLRAHNVADAVAQVHPFGLDLCTGVRTGGALDKGKLQRFFRAVQ